MKKDIHPKYNTIVLLDTSSGTRFVTRSTATSRDTTTLEDGTSVPLVKLDISSASHPFYTGKNTIIDTAGRVEKFNQRRATSEKVQKAAARRAKAK